ncbi:thermonuclease family protein [Polycladomyces subterraneus]|uniref:Thermonuclease family protein n=1 Tax=Polycladomyces subterraneus TaxID=1016997 RepID=A0ABT8IM81_9BACL|nr:thermonuclease family protein [Polycladomyces subterraneus]MDN4593830.1 thermonuclease family protein [Polycladomyces subterraneus]
MKNFLKALIGLVVVIVLIGIALFIISWLLMIGGAIVAIGGLIFFLFPAVYWKLKIQEKDERPNNAEHTSKKPALPIHIRLTGLVLLIIGLISFASGKALYAAISDEGSKQKTKPVQQAVQPNKEPTQVVKQPSSSKPSKTNRVSVKVVDVIDGDTIVVNLNGKNEKLRMILIDTPETVYPNKPKQPFGKEASDFTKKLLLNKTVELEMDVQERDQYGRLLAYVYLNGQSVQEQLLMRGLARVAVFPPNVKHLDEYRAIQDQAKQRKVGIWSIENYVHDDGFHPPQPKVASKPAPKTSSSLEGDSSQSSSASNRSSSSKRSSSHHSSSLNTGDKNCSDFSIQSEAQSYFESHGGSPSNNVDGLDRDHDGIACESLP